MKRWRQAKRLVKRRLGRGQGGPEQRAAWEQRYEAKGESGDFFWMQEETSRELVALVEAGHAPPGAALDLGCGPGVSTAYLAKHFGPVVGMDIAPSAGKLARARWEQEGVKPAFVAAAAPRLPFGPGTFSLVFDRGCMHNLAPADWQPHLVEVARILRAGGVVQLIESRGLTPRKLAEHMPPIFELVHKEQVTQEMRSGTRRMTNVILHKRPSRVNG